MNMRREHRLSVRLRFSPELKLASWEKKITLSSHFEENDYYKIRIDYISIRVRNIISHRVVVRPPKLLSEGEIEKVMIRNFNSALGK